MELTLILVLLTILALAPQYLPPTMSQQHSQTDNLTTYKQRRKIYAYKFTNLTWNNRPTIEMSHDLAVAMQRLREHLGVGNITHSGVYRNRPERRDQNTGQWLDGPPYTGHYFWDAIDISKWGRHGIDRISISCDALSIPYILERNLDIIHIEVNRPHTILRRI